MITADDVPPFVAVVGVPYSTDARCSIVVERTVVMRDIDDFPKAVALFLGIVFCLDLQYPGKRVYEFIQKFVLGLKGTAKLSAKVHTLMNKLLAH